MKFRPQRGGLAESMNEMVEVDGRAGLIEHLRKIHPDFGPPFDAEKVTIEPYGGDGERGCDDDRIGWKDTHIVLVEGWGPVGFCEGPAE